VLFLGWKVFPLVLLYWLENVVVGGYNVAKLLLAQPRQPTYWAVKLFLIPFFIVHFGLFTYGHGVLLVALLGPKGSQPFDILGTVPSVIRANHLGWAVVSLVVSHGLSFYWNYVKNGEYGRASLNALMAQPYGRVIILHFTVLFGGWIVMLLGSPLPALLLLVVIKTAADQRAHKAERQRFAALPPD
jgi:hypothetical protein